MDCTPPWLRNCSDIQTAGVHSTVVKTRVAGDEEEQAGPLPEKKKPADDESTA